MIPARTPPNASNGTRRAHVHRAHEAPLDEGEAAKRIDDLALASELLEVEVNADFGRLLDEEGQDLVERRRLGLDLARRVRADERAVAAGDHVELDEVDADLERGAQRRERVRRSQRGGAPVPDPQRAPLAPLERDHGSGLVGR